jgi:uncharacterized protein (UPF0335 family)
MEIYEEIEMVDGKEQEMDVLDYAKAIIACQIEMKAIQDDIKTIKSDAKENGVLVKEIDSAIKDIKKELKTNPADLQLEQEIVEQLKSNQEVMDAIAMTI